MLTWRFKTALHNVTFFLANYSIFLQRIIQCNSFREYRYRKWKMTNDLTCIINIDSKLFSTSTCLKKFIIFRVLFPRGKLWLFKIRSIWETIYIWNYIYGNPNLFGERSFLFENHVVKQKHIQIYHTHRQKDWAISFTLRIVYSILRLYFFSDEKWEREDSR